MWNAARTDEGFPSHPHAKRTSRDSAEPSALPRWVAAASRTSSIRRIRGRDTGRAAYAPGSARPRFPFPSAPPRSARPAGSHVSGLSGHFLCAWFSVHDYFWHGHGCPAYRLPATRAEFWAGKIDGNRARDRRSLKHLRTAGWRVLVVWECALPGPARLPEGNVLERCSVFLQQDLLCGEITGRWPS
jgi:hypothetical protein